MAKKKVNPLAHPPSASSNDEEVVQTKTLPGEEEEISDDSSDELMNPVNTRSRKKPESPTADVIPEKPSSPAAVTVTQVPGLDSGSEKPKTKKDRRGSPAAKSGKKRSGEKMSTDMHVKRAKKVSGEDAKTPLINRLWSEADEISMLQGMIDFEADTGKSPYEDMSKFYELAMKSICVEASKTQFTDKIRMLKRKYIVKGKEVDSYSKAHDQECARLAKYIWGSDGIALESGVKPKKSEKKLDSLEANGKEVQEEEGVKEVIDCEKVQEDRQVLVNNGKKVEEGKGVLMHGGDSEKASDWFETSFLVRSIASLGVDEFSVKQRWSNVPVETKKRMEDKWKLLQAKEFGIVLEKAEFLCEVSSVIAEDA